MGLRRAAVTQLIALGLALTATSQIVAASGFVSSSHGMWPLGCGDTTLLNSKTEGRPHVAGPKITSSRNSLKHVRSCQSGRTPEHAATVNSSLKTRGRASGEEKHVYVQRSPPKHMYIHCENTNISTFRSQIKARPYRLLIWAKTRGNGHSGESTGST